MSGVHPRVGDAGPAGRTLSEVTVGAPATPACAELPTLAAGQRPRGRRVRDGLQGPAFLTSSLAVLLPPSTSALPTEQRAAGSAPRAPLALSEGASSVSAFPWWPSHLGRPAAQLELGKGGRRAQGGPLCGTGSAVTGKPVQPPGLPESRALSLPGRHMSLHGAACWGLPDRGPRCPCAGEAFPVSALAPGPTAPAARALSGRKTTLESQCLGSKPAASPLNA